MADAPIYFYEAEVEHALLPKSVLSMAKRSDG